MRLVTASAKNHSRIRPSDSASAITTAHAERLEGIDTLTYKWASACANSFGHVCYARHRSPDVIRHAVWLYLRFTLSYRDVEDLLAERGLTVSNESNRRLKFG